jgi:hypothetical protein
VKLAGDSGPPVEDASQFWSIAGTLQYLTFTRPDIAYAMQQICLHMHDPREPHLTAMKCILAIFRGRQTTVFFCIVRAALTSSSTRTLTGPVVQTLTALRQVMWYSWGDNLISWSAKRQTVISRSSAEVEYRVVANGVAEANWLRQLLHELQTMSSRCTLVYCDNISVMYLSTNPVQHQRTKYVEIDLHFVREKVVIGQVHILHDLTIS